MLLWFKDTSAEMTETLRNDPSLENILNDVEIERVHETKFLGVIADDKLCWKAHIKHVKQKLLKAISILYKTRNLLNTCCLYLLYFTSCKPLCDILC